MRKKGFTLVELIAAMAIFTIFSLMVSTLFLQSYKSAYKNRDYGIIEDNIRSISMDIDNLIEKEDSKVIVYNEGKVAKIEGEDGIIEPVIAIIPKDEDKNKVIYFYKGENTALERVEFKLVDDTSKLSSEDVIGTSGGFVIKSITKDTKIESVKKITTERSDKQMLSINFYGVKEGKANREKYYLLVNLRKNEEIQFEMS
ncbi:prepilin-type N-terminal cleavage/methylation domain-containing protein [Clostridium bornimense]|uniref:PilW family protein n=2 Tax=Clostridium TaxID=1485 RepID=UPI001C0FADFE|nr:prepilin-type N-terminal cleavage/methylation domain-containing protein [Clostridium bornimense]MBU5317357.1 prepilin-type N-terminal cleavage/methylation domain-containing protein [Clostridium bornimense]